MKSKLVKLATGTSISLIPAIAFADAMASHDMATDASGSAGVETLLLMLMTMGVFLLFSSLYFLFLATRMYGGVIGKGLKLMSIGIIGVAINEIDSLLHMHFNVDVAEVLFTSSVAESLFHHVLNVTIFLAFTLGLFKLSGVITTLNKPAVKTETAKAK